MTGRRYRLLSEAEWEYVTRAESGTDFYFGNKESKLCLYANGADNSTDIDWRNHSCSDGVAGKTASVGSFKPNHFGLFDLHGNVWEWVEDCWHDNYGDAPSNGSAWLTANRGECIFRVLRGGSWSSRPRNLRSAFRSWEWSRTRSNIIGFRVARDLD